MLVMSNKVRKGQLGWSQALQLMPFALVCFLSQHLQIALADDTGNLLQIQNADFESAPADLAPNSTDQLIQSLPGWQLQGTVQYVTAGENISLPEDAGHAIQLGRDGIISQILNTTSSQLYALTFTVTEARDDNCSITALLNVTLDGRSSQVFDPQGKYSPESWGTYSWGFLADVGSMNLSLRSQVAAGQEPDSNITCGPVVDALFIKELTFPSRQDPGNLLLNGDFEQGPYSLPSSSVGVFLAPTLNSTVSPLPGWNVGPSEPVKFIDKAHFVVPQGNSAVELVSSDPGAIQQSVNSVPGQRYALTFLVGDGNDTCKGVMPVRVKAGPMTTNVSYDSQGTGSSEAFKLEFVANSTTTSVSFTSMHRNFGLGSAFCGPVIDNVVLVASSGFIWRATSLHVITTLLVALSHIFSVD